MVKQDKPKAIVICSDGTGNVGGSTTPTNVWRIRQAIQKRNESDEQQLLIFQDGVGTSQFAPTEVLGKALSYGIGKNLVGLYANLIQAYRPGDRIYMFGFSRGAFTARVLANICYVCGIANCRDENGKLYAPFEIAALADRAIRAYKLRHIKVDVDAHGNEITIADQFREKYGLGPEDVPEDRVDLETLKEELSQPNGRGRVTIEFVGVWDTVASVGLPFENVTQGMMSFFRKVTGWSPALRWASFCQLGFSRPTNTTWETWEDDLHPKIKRAYHALAVDDERQAFKPVLWIEHQKEIDAEGNPTGKYIHKDNVEQVWFSGMHANVGGGYAKDNLAYVSLLWMVKKAMEADLAFEPTAIEQAKDMEDELSTIGDSRSGLGMYYRYQPRLIKELSEEVGLCETSAAFDGDDSWKPKIYDGVFRRIQDCSDTYSPLGIPDFDEYKSVEKEVLPSTDPNATPIVEEAMPSEGTAGLVTPLESKAQSSRFHSVEQRWQFNRQLDEQKDEKMLESVRGTEKSSDAPKAAGDSSVPTNADPGVGESYAHSADEARELAQKITRGYIRLRRGLYYLFFALTLLVILIGLGIPLDGIARIDQAIYGMLRGFVDWFRPLWPIVTVMLTPVLVVFAFLSIASWRRQGQLMTNALGKERSYLVLIPKTLIVVVVAAILRPLAEMLALALIPAAGERLVGAFRSPTLFGSSVACFCFILWSNGHFRSRMVQWNTFAWRALQGESNLRRLAVSSWDGIAMRLKSESKLADLFGRFVVPAVAFAVLACVLAFPVWITVRDVLIRIRIADAPKEQVQMPVDEATESGEDQQRPSSAMLDFSTEEILASGFYLQEGQHYVVKVYLGKDDLAWVDGANDPLAPDLSTGIQGFGNDRMPIPARFTSILKRDPPTPWFHFSGCVGDPFGNTFPIEDGVPFTASSSGQLYVLVNDVPGFYFNNQGTAKIEIIKLGPNTQL